MSTDPREVLGHVTDNIRRLAKRRGISLNALGGKAGVSRSQLFNVLAGGSMPSLAWLTRIGDALGVEPWQLLRPKGRR
jgi:transcriptional regulator with XRE-family HTH domain